jgi:hypothetical protein
VRAAAQASTWRAAAVRREQNTATQRNIQLGKQVRTWGTWGKQVRTCSLGFRVRVGQNTAMQRNIQLGKQVRTWRGCGGA